jgi:hypothetical protein
MGSVLSRAKSRLAQLKDRISDWLEDMEHGPEWWIVSEMEEPGLSWESRRARIEQKRLSFQNRYLEVDRGSCIEQWDLRDSAQAALASEPNVVSWSLQCYYLSVGLSSEMSDEQLDQLATRIGVDRADIRFQVGPKLPRGVYQLVPDS